MIVSLDAEKAFDSVSHSYIKKILIHIGLERFCPVFDLLYHDQKVDIVLNCQIVGTYKIKNGVKQGDALCCILFILGIEPLLRNIQQDPLIETLTYHGINMPKTLAYADDVACITKPTQENLNLIFSHYEKMTAASGLKLNADKTELIQRGGQDSYSIKYLSDNSTVFPSDVIKINGLQLSYDTHKAIDLNLTKVFTSMESQFRLWKNMYLSILGKIIVFKTFGLSQILFIAATTVIPPQMEKKLNNLIYKFLWNSNLDNKKAPDRIKRNIMLSPVSLLGFGMLDYREVVKSIRIKTLTRILTMEAHPICQMLKNSLSNSVINTELIYSINPVLDDTVSTINKLWKYRIKNCKDDERDVLYTLIVNEYVGNLLLKRFKNKRQGLFHRHDKLSEIIASNPQHPVLKKIDKSIYHFVQNGGSRTDLTTYKYVVPTQGKILLTNSITSKLIRTLNNPLDTITPKILEDSNLERLKNLGNKIKSLTNTKLKTIILRAIHGDIYCGTRLKKFGITDTDGCQRCGSPETIKHLLFECNYVQRIWDICSKLTSIPINNIDGVLGLHDYHDKTTLTIHCEIIRRLLAIERPLTNQILFVKSVIDRLATVERGISKYSILQLQLQLTKAYPIGGGSC